MKLAVIYDSKTNNTAAVAGYMAEAMNSLEGVEAKNIPVFRSRYRVCKRM